MNQKRFSRIQERLVYQNRWVELYDDIVMRPDGTEGTYIRLTYHGNPTGVVIVPRLPDGRFLMLRVNRYAVSAASLEFPRGGGRVNEDTIASGVRELAQETGLVATKWEVMGYQYPDNAIVMTRVAVLLAVLPENTPDLLRLNTDEAIVDSSLVTCNEISALVRNGNIADGFTLSALAVYHSCKGGLW